MKTTKKTMKRVLSNNNCIIFDSNMRKTFVEGVMQDVKGYFENKTDGKVSVSYEEKPLKNHEFCFKMYVKKEDDCTRQMWSEVTSAIVNIVSYMFPASSANNIEPAIDVMFCSDTKSLEVEVVSNW